MSTGRAVRTAAVFTHRRPAVTRAALHELIALARERGVELRFDVDETAKHDLQPGASLILNAAP